MQYPLPIRPTVVRLVPFLSGQLLGGFAEPFHCFQILPHGFHGKRVRLLSGGQLVDLPLPCLRGDPLAAVFQVFLIPEVDADANANLNEVLGVEPEVTLGELREEIERAGIDPRYQIPSGMTKQAYLEMRLSDAIAEEDDYDLMVMGRTQGQGCYCFVNGLVQTQVQKLQSHYPYIVVDNEAGMEHISRGILPMMEVAILVSDCSRRGVQAAGRIAKLMKELNFKPQKIGLIVNRVPDGKLDAGTLEEIRNQGLELLGVVPHDDQVYQYDCDGKPIIQLPKDSPVRSALGEIVKKLGL